MDYRNLFDDVMHEKYDNTALSDDEAFIRIVKERAENMKKNKTRSKKPAIIAASIAAAAVLTVSAGAASNWTFSFLGDFSSIFGGNTAEYNIVETASYSNSDSDLSFELVGVAVDSNLFRAMVDIYPPEGTEFIEDNKPKINSDISFGMDLVDYHGSYGSSSKDYILSDTPQKIRVMLTYSCSPGFENKNIEFTAEKMLRDEEGNFKGFEDIWYTRIKTGRSAKKQTYSLHDMTVRFDENNYIEATKAEVSGMTATVFCKMYGKEYYRFNKDVYVTLTDGSKLKAVCESAGSFGTDGKFVYLFDDIVKPTDLVSITTDGHEIKLR